MLVGAPKGMQEARCREKCVRWVLKENTEKRWWRWVRQVGAAEGSMIGEVDKGVESGCYCVVQERGVEEGCSEAGEVRMETVHEEGCLS